MAVRHFVIPSHPPAALLADPETGELTPEGSIPDAYLEQARSALEDDR